MSWKIRNLFLKLKFSVFHILNFLHKSKNDFHTLRCWLFPFKRIPNRIQKIYYIENESQRCTFTPTFNNTKIGFCNVREATFCIFCCKCCRIWQNLITFYFWTMKKKRLCRKKFLISIKKMLIKLDYLPKWAKIIQILNHTTKLKN